MTIDVKCYTTEIRPIICCCTEVRRGRVTAPIVALLVTVAVEPGNKEAGVKRIIADEQLVCVSVDYLHVVPQSISTSRVAIVTGGCYWLVRSSLKIALVSSLVILEDNFFEKDVVAVCPVPHTSVRKQNVVYDFILGFGMFISSVTHCPSSIK